MPAPSYQLTNYTGTADPAGDIIALAETQLTNAGWVFVEAYAFTQAATARVMRVWKNPSTLNASHTDFFIGLVKNAVAGVYMAMRVFEVWDAVGKTIDRPCIAGNASSVPVGVQFTQRVLPSNSNWISVAYGNGVFVAVAQTSTIAATSPDGITWTQRVLPVSAAWISVTYGAGVFVAIAQSSTIAATSPDGITWTQRVLPISTFWQSVTFGNGVFVAVAQGGTIAATSPDGITWTQRVLPASVNWWSVTYGAGVFVAVAQSGTIAATSPDGITWTQRVLPASTFWQSVTFGNGVFVAVAQGSTIAASSPDGITWTPRSMPATVSWRSVAFGNGAFVAVAQSSSIAATSSDGITWLQATQVNASPWTAVAYGNGVFTVVASGGGGVAATTDGVSATYAAPGGPWLPTGATAPAMVDAVAGLVATTNYDVGILASKSYLVIGVNLNGTGTSVFSWVLGLFNPAYPESQAVYPPLMALSPNIGQLSSACGVSRAMRTIAGASAFSVAAGPEALLLGAWLGAVRESNTNQIRPSRVALGGYAITGFTTNGGFRGWLLDAVAVNAAAAACKVGDTVTIGGTVYTALAGSGAIMNFWATGACTYFFDTAAGS